MRCGVEYLGITFLALSCTFLRSISFKLLFNDFIAFIWISPGHSNEDQLVLTSMDEKRNHSPTMPFIFPIADFQTQ